eukprot:983582-Pyramimonas_sp.AAC.1
MSCAIASSSQQRSSSFGSSEASIPKSSICETPSATPSSIGETRVASASRWPPSALRGWVFWNELRGGAHKGVTPGGSASKKVTG